MRNKLYIFIILFIAMLYLHFVAGVYLYQNYILLKPNSYSKSGIVIGVDNIDDETVALYLDVSKAPYNVSEYKRKIFDCSNMAYMLHDWLEDSGWDVTIHHGSNHNLSERHSWIVVHGSKDYTVEATTKQILATDYQDEYMRFQCNSDESPCQFNWLNPAETSYPKRW